MSALTAATFKIQNEILALVKLDATKEDPPNQSAIIRRILKKHYKKQLMVK